MVLSVTNLLNVQAIRNESTNRKDSPVSRSSSARSLISRKPSVMFAKENQHDVLTEPQPQSAAALVTPQPILSHTSKFRRKITRFEEVKIKVVVSDADNLDSSHNQTLISTNVSLRINSNSGQPPSNSPSSPTLYLQEGGVVLSSKPHSPSFSSGGGGTGVEGIGGQALNPPHSLSTSDFTAIKRLGKGGQGTVLLVTHNHTHHPYALKIIEKDSIHLSSYAKIFEEQMVMKMVKDNSCCSSSFGWCCGLKGSWQDSNNFYILTEYYPGGDLRKRVKRSGGTLPYTATRRYFAELVYAVSILHSHQIIHRDLKLHNVVLDENDHIVLIDFGISQAMGPVTKPWKEVSIWNRKKKKRSKGEPSSSSSPKSEGKVKLIDVIDAKKSMKTPSLNGIEDDSDSIPYSPCGTPGYMPPEAFTKAGYTYASDIWCMGIMLHIMLLGKVPFGLRPSSQTTQEIIKRTNTEPIEFGPDEYIDSEAEDLLHKMLEKDPEKRISIEAIKAHPFLKSIDWRVIAERKPDHTEHRVRMRTTKTPNNDIHIPCGVPYSLGTEPFSWFQYVSPDIYEAVSLESSNLVHADSECVDEEDAALLPPPPQFIQGTELSRPAGTLKVVSRLKQWWKHSKTGGNTHSYNGDWVDRMDKMD